MLKSAHFQQAPCSAIGFHTYHLVTAGLLQLYCDTLQHIMHILHENFKICMKNL